MDQAPFYRLDLDGGKSPVSFDELYPLLRDIVFYFELNLAEQQNVLVLDEFCTSQYWKSLSVSWAEPEFAESRRYAWLCERGCMALMNGAALCFLTEQQSVESALWLRTKAWAREAMPYLRHFQPSDEILEEGRTQLLDALGFIADMSEEDLDEHGIPAFDTTSQGVWFTTNIVGDYFRTTAQLDFG